MSEQELLQIIKRQTQVIATLTKLLDKKENPPVMVDAQEFEAWSKSSKGWK